MNTRSGLNFPTQKATWMPRRGRLIRTFLDFLFALVGAAVIAAALFLFL